MTCRTIALSQGQFTLVLARCNYTRVRERVIAELLGRCPEARVFNLPPTLRLLYPALQGAMADRVPSALLVLGLEQVTALDSVLTGTGQMRDRFSQLSCPVVLWLTDMGLERLARLSPDLKNWAAVPVRFDANLIELENLILEATEAAFLEAATATLGYTIAPLAPIPDDLGWAAEVRSARAELEQRGQALSPLLLAGVEFILARAARVQGDWAGAIAGYGASIGFWQQPAASQLPKAGERLALLQFELALTHTLRARAIGTAPEQVLADWQMARQVLEACAAGLARIDRPDWTARFVGPLAEVLLELRDWSALAALVNVALSLHEAVRDPLELARDCGFLAELALAQGNWSAAARAATEALSWLAKVDRASFQQEKRERKKEEVADPLVGQGPELGVDPLTVRQVDRWLRARSGLYWLLLAEAEAARQSDLSLAITYYERARSAVRASETSELTVRILRRLRAAYFAAGKYRSAFAAKQNLRRVEHQAGRLAFIGAGRLKPSIQAGRSALPRVAPEIEASGRHQDIATLMARLARNDCTLTVLHGQSGAGKSSLLEAGLVPELLNRALGDRDGLPVYVEVYADWVGAIEAALEKASDLKGLGLVRAAENWAELELDPPALEAADRPSNPVEVMTAKLQGILKQLTRNSQAQLLTVLIFDQFEEFFLTWTRPIDRRLCFEFLRDCLNLPYTKVILSLREDYLHLLLEWERSLDLDAIDNNPLGRSVRYFIGDFSPEDARRTIETLTARSHFGLEPALIDALVRELAAETGRITPIELQIVGAQLQADNVRTLDDYWTRYGSKAVLVERHLHDTIRDCGPAREPLAREVLFLLTGENGTRPLKTRTELAAELDATDEELGPVLDILAGSGLVMVFRESAADFYQLVHDYLVGFIRRQRLASERARFRLTQAQLNRILKKRVRELKWAGAILSVLLVASIGSALRLAAGETSAQIDATTTYADALLRSQQPFESLTVALQAAAEREQRQLLLFWPGDPGRQITRLKVATALESALATIRETNRIVGHSETVWDASFSTDGESLVTASSDRTARLWNRHGKPLTDEKGRPIVLPHEASVTSAVFSPDGQRIATASGSDKPEARLWDRTGRLLAILKGHTKTLFCISFSPDGQTIATASEDHTVKLWDRQGRLLTTLAGHGETVEWLAFSPDGQILATASDDRTIKLWSRDGKVLHTLVGHTDWVVNLAFSPDGRWLASTSYDGTVRLWSREGEALRVIQPALGRLYGVAISPDGQTIAAGTDEKTIALWDLDGNLRQTLRGHTDRVLSVAFSPDGQGLVSTSYDTTTRLWRLAAPELNRWTAHTDRVYGMDLSEDGQSLATTSQDRTLALWRSTGQRLATAKEPSTRLRKIAFIPKSPLVIMGGEDGRLQVRDRTGQVQEVWEDKATIATTDESDRPAITSGLAVSPNGQRVAVAYQTGRIVIWQRRGSAPAVIKAVLETGKDPNRRADGLAFSPDGRHLATSHGDGRLKIWDSNGKLEREIVGHGNYATDVAFSPDSRFLVSGGGDNSARLWTIEGQELAVFPHDDAIASVRFSPDGEFIATGSFDGTTTLWHINGQKVKTFREHRNAVTAVRFSPDGRTLFSTGFDGTIIRRSLDEPALLDRACTWLADYIKTHPRGKKLNQVCHLP